MRLKCKPRVKSPAPAGLFFTFPAANQALDANPASFDPLVGTRQPRADALGKSERGCRATPRTPSARATAFSSFRSTSSRGGTSIRSIRSGPPRFSDSYASSDDSVHLPGFLRFDAGVLAQIDASWKARLNIENIFNTGYWASADGNNNISLAQPRTFRLKVTAKL